jgi:hypothetical protein
MFGPHPHPQISDAEQGDFSELPDIHSMDIGIFGPYTQISDDE